ncbi:MAG: hypothetical protein ACPG5T_09745 [Endozoicomonas sp.]
MEPTQLFPTPREASLTSGKHKSREGTFFADHEVACETLLLTAYCDPILQNLLTDTQIRTFLQDRKILTFPITSFLLETDPVVRPAHIETLEESVKKEGSPIIQHHINELRTIERDKTITQHTGIDIIKTHPKIGEISYFTEFLRNPRL